MSNLILQASKAAEQSDMTTIIITVIGTIGAGGLVKLVQMFLQHLKDKRESVNAPAEEYKDSLKERVVELEDNLEALRLRIEELITMYSEKILVLSTERATLVAKLEAALAENEALREELKELTKE